MFHDATTVRQFGQAKFANKKYYLQCLLVYEQLCHKGLVALPSGQSSWYYRAVLASPHPSGVATGAPVQAYKALLFGDGQVEDADGDGPPGAVLGICDSSRSDDASDVDDEALSLAVAGSPADPVAREASDQFPLALRDAGQFVVPMLHASWPGGARTVASPRRSQDSDSSSEASSGGSGQEIVSLAPGGGLLAPGQARAPVNSCIRVEEHLLPGTPGHYRRYTTVCPLASSGHCAVVACGKRRNCGSAQMGSLGPAAPEAFLMVWREQAAAFRSKADHQRWSPTWAEVRRYMIDHGWSVSQ